MQEPPFVFPVLIVGALDSGLIAKPYSIRSYYLLNGAQQW